jgi:histidinol dehydrogenase
MPLPALNIRRIDTRRDAVQSAVDELRERLSPRGNVVSAAGRQRTIDVFGEPLTPQQVVERICGDVQLEGLDAVLRYTRLLDRAELTPETIRVEADELTRAHRQADPDFLATVRRIRDRILTFQRAILHRTVGVAPANGVQLRQRYRPLRRVGICVPGGAAAYPSTVLMTAVPAQAAGVEQIAVVAPPTPFGAFNPNLLATCQELGIREVYRVGGAQGVAALAYGVSGVPPVDKLVGPGNLFVALAKRHVFGPVAIDSIAGPSEVVILADDGARADFLAADLLAQAEHAPGASVLIAWQDAVIDRVEAELRRQVVGLARSDVTVESLEAFGCLIRARNVDEACELTDQIAPEHLQIATADAGELAERIHNAGAIFLGYWSPVALGDYAAGPSHVLPTGGTARWASGLSANDFLRSASVIQFDADALRSIADDVRRMADVEGLTAHRASIDVRMNEPLP